ncbi:MAG: T9SS type A sorting domain-containing protein, partial [Bacteroidia bacterium]
ACAVNGNRQVVVTGNMTVPVHAFNSCDPNPAGNPLTFRVNINGAATGPVTVAGNFQAAAGYPGDWDPATTILDNVPGTSMYQKTLWINAPGTFQYKFINNGAWESVPGTCAVGGNREVVLANANGMMTPDVCINSCDPCPTGAVDTLYVRFHVNMENEILKIGGSAVGTITSIAGTMNGWGGGSPLETDMDDVDGDKVYTKIFHLAEGLVEYKFRFNSGLCGGVNWEPGNNRQFTILGNNGDTVDVAVVCFGETVNCTPLPPPINVTFRVDMQSEVVNDSVFVAGDFQLPCTWAKTALKMNQVGTSSIYERTVLVFPGRYGYRYENGIDPAVGEETTNFDNFGCGNNDFGHNRKLDITGMTTPHTEPAYLFNSCDATLISIEDDLNNGKAVSVVPNPFNTSAKISFANPNAISYNVTITNLAGQIVKRMADVKGTSIEVNKNDLGAEGIYFLTIANAKGEKFTQKLVLQ